MARLVGKFGQNLSARVLQPIVLTNIVNAIVVVGNERRATVGRSQNPPVIDAKLASPWAACQRLNFSVPPVHCQLAATITGSVRVQCSTAVL